MDYNVSLAAMADELGTMSGRVYEWETGITTGGDQGVLDAYADLLVTLYNLAGELRRADRRRYILARHPDYGGLSELDARVARLAERQGWASEPFTFADLCKLLEGTPLAADVRSPRGIRETFAGRAWGVLSELRAARVLREMP